MLELGECDLNVTLEKKKQWSEEEVIEIIRQTASGLEAAEKKNISHGDVKPQNFILGFNKRYHLTDFSAAKIFLPGQKATTNRGAYYYLTPELQQMREDEDDEYSYDPFEADRYAFGVMIFKLITGKRYSSN